VEWPTLDFNLYQPRPGNDGPPDPFYSAPRPITNPIQLAQALHSTSFSAMDQRYISKRHWARTIAISTEGVRLTEFNLTDAQKQKLLDSGQSAARSFLSSFSFEEYLRTWRASPAAA
jgi:NTE family protein